MKKLTAIVIAILLCSSVLVGCSEAGEKKPEEKKVKIGFVTDQGGINDGSFNQLAWEGVKKAETDLKIEKLNPIESKQPEQYEPNLKTMAQNADLTVGAGFMMMQSMENVAKQTADKKFAIIDGTINLPNVLSITFKENEGSFLVGVIAGKMTKTNKIGFIGGMEGEVINKFEAGFAAGVLAVNPEAFKGLKSIASSDGKTITPGKTVKYVDSFDDQGKGYEAAKMLYNDGCDVIFHAAGGVGLGVFKAAKEMGKYAIGVDADQAVTAKDYADVIICSMAKKVDVAVYNAIKDLVENKFQGGSHKVLGIKEDGVGLAPTIHKDVKQEYVDLANKYKDAIKDAKFVVPGTRKELLEFKAPEI